MARRTLVLLAAVAVLLRAAGVATASAPPRLRADGPTAVAGTDASGVFEIGGRTIRQVRYADGGTLVYTFDLSNEGTLPVQVDGLAELPRQPRLFEVLRLVDADESPRFTIGAGETRTVALHLLMRGCETLSARAGSFVTEVQLRTTGPMGLGDHVVVVPLPEEVRTGSPREAGCANATATSRPPG